MRLRFVNVLLSAIVILLAGCGQKVADIAGEQASIGDWQTVRLHFTTFSKSKSGAT